MTVAENHESASAGFLAKIVSKKKSDALEKDGVDVTLEVEKFWKGKIQKKTVCEALKKCFAGAVSA